MKISSLKILDKWLGRLLTVVLQVAAPLLGRLGPHIPEIDAQHPRWTHITIIKILGLGSLLHLAPQLEQLKKERPNISVSLITSHTNHELVELLPVIDHVLTLSINSPMRLLLDCISIYRRYRLVPADELYDAEFLTNFSSILTVLARARHKTGFQGKAHRNRVYHRVVSLEENGHIQADFQRLLGLDQLGFGPLSLDINRTEPIFSQDFPDYHHLIGININVSSVAYERRWPLSYFRELLDFIAKHTPEVVFVFTGLVHETPFVEQFIESLEPHLKQRCRLYSGKTSLTELIALFQQLSMFISSDSGPLALAVSLDIPTISFWGPETPRRYGPRVTSEKHLIFDLDIACSPCLLAENNKTPPCHGHNICMSGLKPDLVFARLKKSGFLETYL